MRDKNNTHASSKQLLQATKQTFGFGGVSEAVGSSRIRIRESRISPRRISTIWRSATSSEPARLCRSNWQPSAASKFFIFCMESCFLPAQTRCFLLSTGLGKAAVPRERDKYPADEHELALIWCSCCPQSPAYRYQQGNTGNNLH